MLLMGSCYTSNEVRLDGDCETIWAEVLFKDQRKLNVSSFYRPPDHKHAHLDKFREAFERLMEKVGRLANSVVIIGGHLNFPDIDWENHCVKGTSGRKALRHSFLDFLAEFSFSQMVSQCTRESSVLDLFIANIPGIVKNVNIIPRYSDHEALVVDCTLSPKYIKKIPRKIYLFSQAKWDEICAAEQNGIL